MNMIKLFFIVVLILTINLVGCGGVEKKTTDSHTRLIQLAKETLEIVAQIEEHEMRYAQKKSLNDWTIAYQLKRAGVDSLLIQLNDKILEGRFFEKLPEEGLTQKAKIFLHAAENIKIYINTTNVDMTQLVGGKPPPAFDVYSSERYLKPATSELQKILDNESKSSK